MHKTSNNAFSRTVLAFTAASALALASCASWQNQVEAQVSKASGVLEAAKTAGAARLAPETVQSAESYLSQAQQLLQAGRLEDAIRSAYKASADAQLALAQTEAGGKNAKIDALRQEIASLMR